MSYLENTSFAEHGQFAWDATSMKLASTCQRLYYYSMVESWEPRKKSVHLVFGGIYASALEHYYKFVTVQKLSHDEALLEVVRYALVESWVHKVDENGNRLKGTGHQMSFEDAAKTRESLIRTIVWYLEEFKESEFEVFVTADGEPAVELTFKLPVYDDVIFTGHIDRLVEYGGAKFVTDQKTTGGTLGPYFFSQFDLDIQMSNYTFAGQIIFNSPIKGVMIDGAAIGTDYTQFLRGFTHRSASQLDEWFESMQGVIAQTRNNFVRFKHSQDPKEFPMNLTACGNYGGCPFKSVCSMPAKVRPNVLKGDYVKKAPWDPLVER